ncbi:MAG: class I SAM-dependent methyltransferase [Candidatus Thermoplasmatota archaeon]|nr:class I SAM-dependent methyltransferase [Candidatus Thermoplasmatota archaeon]
MGMSEEKRIVEEGYDRIAEAYTDARREMKQRNETYVRLLLKRLRPDSKILDAGCGSGIPITKVLAERHDVTGVDISSRQVERARTLIPEASFLKADMTRLSFPAGTFDAVVSFYAIIHVPREEHQELLGGFHRMLRRGGLLLVTLGSDSWVGTEEYKPFGVRMHWSHYGPEEYRQMLAEVGFEVLSASIEEEEFQGEPERTFYVLGQKA